MARLNLSNAAKLDITIPAYHSYDIAIKIKEKVSLIYQEFTGDWKLVVARDIDGNQPVKTFTDGSGFYISIDLLTLTLDTPTIQALIKPGSYFYDLRRDDGGYSKRPIKGDFIVESVIGRP